MIPAATRYARAGSLEEALDLLAEPDAKVLAGGQSLIPVLKLRIARPSLLVDVGALGLDEIRERDGEVRIGALATWDDLARSGTTHAVCDGEQRRLADECVLVSEPSASGVGDAECAADPHCCT